MTATLMDWFFYDRIPLKYTMTFPVVYHMAELPAKVHFKQTIKGLYALGRIEIRLPSGHEVVVYSIERTLCDIVRGKNAQDIQPIQHAMKKYVSSKNLNIPFLLNYVEKTRVLAKIQAYVVALA